VNQGRKRWQTPFAALFVVVCHPEKNMLKAKILAPLLCAVSLGAVQNRVNVSFDGGWRFFRGDALHAEDPDFDDPYWAVATLPHDWSIDGPFGEKNPTGGAGAFLPAGVGWYRKHFLLPGDYQGQRLFVEFDGVMANSDVWINGHHLGKRPNGYVSFRYELTPYLRKGLKDMNVLAVRVDNSAQPASRWYSGAGIYRHVHLLITGPIHFDQWSTVVTTPQISSREAAICLNTGVVNQSDSPHNVSVQILISGPDGKTVQILETAAQAIAPGSSAKFRQDLVAPSPQLWDINHPYLYLATVRVRESGTTIDEESARFGIREFHFDPATGFWLNGKNFKIKGVCLHHEAGPFGAAVPSSVWERRLTSLKEFGVNAIRTAHNPASPDFLDLCDRMGFLVMEEMFDTWKYAKNPYDYHLYFDDWSKIDTADTVRRDRNHPAIILYSAGNEIRDTPKAEMAKGILQSLIDVFHQFDPTRPVTQALFRPNVSHDYDDGLADMLDVIGQNYREDEIVAAHDARPTRKIIGTENGHDLKVWLALRDHPAYAGQFLWTGFDYLGESRAWPRVGAGAGLFDRTGRPRPIAFQRKSWWSDDPVVYVARRVAGARATPSDPGFEPLQRRQEVFSDWTPADTSAHPENVEVYSNCETVELLLNGTSLGSKPRPEDDSPRIWSVPFAPGIIEAIGRNRGQVAARHKLSTAGKAARILLSADQQNLKFSWDDVVSLRAVVVDAQNVPVPGATDTITFQGNGPAFFAGVDNGDNHWHDSFHGPSCPALDGQCVAYLKAKAAEGQVTVTATAPGLASAAPMTIRLTGTN
jgi:beta-galactosidase